MQDRDQGDDTGVNKHHKEMLLIWIKLIQSNSNQIKLTQPLLTSTYLLSLVVLPVVRSWFQVLMLAF